MTSTQTTTDPKTDTKSAKKRRGGNFHLRVSMPDEASTTQLQALLNDAPWGTANKLIGDLIAEALAARAAQQ